MVHFVRKYRIVEQAGDEELEKKIDVLGRVWTQQIIDWEYHLRRV